MIRFIALALVSCRTGEPPLKNWARRPDTAIAFFAGSVRAGEYRNAWLTLSADTRRHIPEEAMILAFETLPTVARIVGACEVESVSASDDSGKATVVNHLMGLRFDVGLRREFKKVWTIDLAPGQWNKLTQASRDWLALQWEDTLGRQILPPDARPVGLGRDLK